jgi:SAM-dependent methyltransferase
MSVALPWQAKIAAKIVLSRIPVSYRLWKKLSLFEHGQMDSPDYCYKVVKQHLDREPFGRRHGDFVSLELGPGDTITSALAVKALGAAKTLHIDVGPFASRDLEAYRQMADHLRKEGLDAPDISTAQTFEDVLKACDAEYYTNGVESMKTLPDASVDIIWSHAVLEHVGLREFDESARQMRRLLRPDGVCTHVVDLKDHLSRALNSLRFSEGTWESNLMSRSGFYTNRIRCLPMLERFEKAGFEVVKVEKQSWPTMPTPRTRMAEPFRSMSEDDLRVHGFTMVLKPI